MRRSPQYEEEREKRSEEMRPIFDQLVAEYRFHCVRHYGKELVSYKVLADLVLDGWRPPAELGLVGDGASGA